LKNIAAVRGRSFGISYSRFRQKQAVNEIAISLIAEYPGRKRLCFLFLLSMTSFLCSLRSAVNSTVFMVGQNRPENIRTGLRTKLTNRPQNRVFAGNSGELQTSARALH
jgi:hypothetical protein